MKTIKDLQMEEDKLSIFFDFNKLTQYVVTVKDLIDAFSICLSDTEKFEVMTKSDYFSRLKPFVQSDIIMSIKDDSIKSQIIQNTKLMESAFDQYRFIKFLKTVNDESKMYVLNNPEILKRFNVAKYEIKEIIGTMSNENRIAILSNRELINQLEIGTNDIVELIERIENDEEKFHIAEQYELTQYDTVRIIKSCSDEKKKSILLEDKETFNRGWLLDIITSFEVEALIDFINTQQEFLASKNLKPFQIIKRMFTEKQLKLVEKIEEMQLSEGEKRRCYAALENDTKQNIDINKIDEKYRELIGMKLSKEYPTIGQIIPQLNGDFQKYADLDELLSINPLQMVTTDKDREQLLKLCQICPHMNIEDNLELGASTGEDYIKGEKWVNSVLDGIQPEWTDVQKLAYIDTMIGKKISYTPEFGTEAEQLEEARMLWRIITSGYGVCNGIAQVEQYLLSRVGIEAELVSSGTHSYVKVKNIKVSTQNGIIEGDTLVDPTWNLTASRYGSRPHYFCKNYEEMRKADIDGNGIDHKCHKNDELEQAEIINIDIQSLREVYKSIGITDRNGNFPIVQLIEQSEQIDKTSTDMLANINSKIALLKKWCPEFATCQNSTIDILKDILFEANEHFNFKRCIASRVYNREDPKKQAILYVYIELEDVGKLFFYADKENGEFIQMSQEEFERKFECYEADMQKLPDNKRPWETDVEIEQKKENSSGEIVAEEGR